MPPPAAAPPSVATKLTRAGLPATIAPAGIERRTTEPAPTTAPSPISTPAVMIAFAPIQTSLPITMSRSRVSCDLIGEPGSSE